MTIEDQDVDLYYRVPAQAPDDLTQAQYKARINVVDLPKSQSEPDVSDVHSFVVTLHRVRPCRKGGHAGRYREDRRLVRTCRAAPGTTCSRPKRYVSKWTSTVMERLRTVADTQKEIQDQLDNLKKDKSQDSSS